MFLSEVTNYIQAINVFNSTPGNQTHDLGQRWEIAGSTALPLEKA